MNASSIDNGHPDLNPGGIKGVIKLEPAGHGGARPGAGRKPSEIKRRMRELIADKAEAAERALALCQQIADDPKAPAAVRLAAAKELMDRCWGKARQSIDLNRGDGPSVDMEAQRAMLADPETARLAAELDARIANQRAEGRGLPAGA